MNLDGKYIEINRNNCKTVVKILEDFGYVADDILLRYSIGDYDKMFIEPYKNSLYMWHSEIYIFNSEKMNINILFREHKLKRILKTKSLLK